MIERMEKEKENSNVEDIKVSKPNTTPSTPFSSKGSIRHFSTSTRTLNREPKEPSNSSMPYSKDVIEFLKNNNIEPVYVYENLGDKSIQNKVLNDTRNLAGVYLILNKFNLSCYIGSASTGKFNSRFRRHLFNFLGSKVIKAAVKKYKINNFAFIILDIFTEEVNKENNKQLLDMEDYYIKSLLPDYNILTEAGNTFGYKHSEMTRLKMVENYSPERCLWIGNINRNKPMSEQHKENIRKAALTRVRPIYSEEALVSMRKSSKSIIVYNLDKTVYGEYPSITAGAESLRCSVKTI
jgi:group I intron endonuclease